VVPVEPDDLGDIGNWKARELRTAAPETQQLPTAARAVRAVCILKHLERHAVRPKWRQRAGARTSHGTEFEEQILEALFLVVGVVPVKSNHMRTA
jgi:hypothetical protein